MPELPEVETVCRVMRRVLVGERIARVEIVRDPIVFSGHSPRAIEQALVGRVVEAVGRRGKYFWVALGGPGPTVYGHLGMSGWVREVGREGTRLHGHGEAPFDDAAGRPRFLRLRLETTGGRAVAFTDPRRLGRIWLGVTPDRERRVARLGPDAHDDLPPVDVLATLFARRRTAIKAVLLDQGALAGIGNWIADEVLYQARIAPARPASSLAKGEVGALRRAIHRVLTHAVKVGADHRRFPKTWLFEHRWGGDRGAARIGGQPIVRQIVGGRTTAWVPTRQV
ncbi:MAG: DNA-formamidopyrimidine glycosylase family protein [Polyangiaceae bacterium]